MQIGDVVDGRFKITGICSLVGGMGNIVHVADLSQPASVQLVLKYCKSFNVKDRKRFAREIRVLASFRGNGRVVQIYAFNPHYDPPYFVMPFYKDGDLNGQRARIAADPAEQERLFCKMIDCLIELHSAGVYHRDIKPSNFLLDGDSVVVSDLGLTTAPQYESTITSTMEAWGSLGYTPPEARNDGFKDADASYDVFMLGKSFYNVLTGRDPLYMTDENIPAGLFHVLQRATSPERARRYQTLADLKQAVVSVFDIILNRVEGFNSCRSKLATITSRLADENQYYADEVNDFIDSLAKLHDGDRDGICQMLEPSLFSVVSQDPINNKRRQLLESYGVMVKRDSYGWSFAERIAECMKEIVLSSAADDSDKAFALDLAIHAAYKQNRFAAMGTCTKLITGIVDDKLADHVRPVLLDYQDSFVSSIEPSSCNNDIIGRTIRELKARVDRSNKN